MLWTSTAIAELVVSHHLAELILVPINAILRVFLDKLQFADVINDTGRPDRKCQRLYISALELGSECVLAVLASIYLGA